MNAKNKQLQSLVLEYLKSRFPDLKLSSKGMFDCPFSHNHKEETTKPTANIFPVGSNSIFCFDPNCQKLGDIYDLCRKIDFDNNKDVSDEDIEMFLTAELNINLNNPLDKLLEQYQTWGWSVFPIAKDTKRPLIKEWQTKEHKNIEEWKNWVKNGSGLGVSCGKISNLIPIDCDILTKEEADIVVEGTKTKKIEELKKKKQEGINKLKALPYFQNTAFQDSGLKGIHFLFQYDSDIPNSSFNYEGFHFDVQGDGAYLLIEPSTYCGIPRVMSGTEIKPMPEDLKKFILDNVSSKKEVVTTEECNWDSDVILKNLDGQCNNTFVKILGQLRKYMNPDQVERTAHIVNQQLLDNPMENRDIKAMCSSINNYHNADLGEIGNAILKHMKLVKQAHVKDLKECLGFARQDLEKSLVQLCEQNKIIKTKKDLYDYREDIIWKSDYTDLSTPLKYKIPIFGKYANFNEGSMIVIGGKSGTGKTHVAMEFVDGFVKQGLIPRVITTEADSGLGELAVAKSIPEGKFVYYQTAHPTSVPFYPNEVRIIDWLRAPKSEFHKLDQVYSDLNDKLVENGGVLIIFAQLRKENGTFYAEDMVEQFACFVAKFLYPEVNGKVDNKHPYFLTTKVRRSKIGKQYFEIPMLYNDENKSLMEI